MSLLRALRAYIGLGPDEDIEGRYLYDLNSRRRELDLDEIEDQGESLFDAGDVALNAENGFSEREEETFDDLDLVDVNFGDGDRRPDRSRRPGDVGLDALGFEDFPDEEIDLDVEEPFEEDDVAIVAPTRRGKRSGGAWSRRSASAEMAPAPSVTVADKVQDDTGPLDFLPDGPKAQEGAVVHSLDSMRAKPRTLCPESFADAKDVADEFKRDVPVLLNLQGIDRDLARRLIDFASGICYVLDGSMEKVASQVFLLIPEAVEVSDDDRRRIEERGYAR